MRWYATFVRLLLGSLIALAVVATTPVPAAAWQASPTQSTQLRPARTTWSVNEEATITLTVDSNIATPGTPEIRETFSSRQISVLWTNAASPTIQGFVVERERRISSSWFPFGSSRTFGTAPYISDTPGEGTFRYRIASVIDTRRSEWSTFAVVTLDATGPQPPEAALNLLQYRNTQRPLGMNLSGVSFYTREWPFTNIFKVAMPWISSNDRWVNGGVNAWSTAYLTQMEFDRDGYPLELPGVFAGAEAPQLVRTYIYKECAGAYPGGNYVLLYDGEGQFSIRSDAAVISTGPNRIRLRITPTNLGIDFAITRSVRGNHVRNIRLIPEANEFNYETRPFNTTFSQRLQPFSVLRFMNWQVTNFPAVSQWTDRPTPATFSFGTPKGVSIEAMIDLSNYMNADPWLCIPHHADEDYIRQMAILVRDRLAPERKVYIEYSNEIWNSLFDQYRWLNANGPAELGLARRAGYYAGRAFTIWRDVFRGQEHRLVRVAAGQAATPWILEQILIQLNGNVDAAAIAHYFDLTHQPNWDASTTVDQITAQLAIDTTGAPSNQRDTTRWIPGNLAVARRFNVPLLLYEGGQHILPPQVGTNASYMAALTAAQRHPEMYRAYVRQVDYAFSQGATLFNGYSYATPWNQWGWFGHLERQNESIGQAMKYRGLIGMPP